MNYERLVDYISALPMEKQVEIETIVNRMIEEWDPEFEKLTPAEEKELSEIIEKGEYIPEDQINWND